MKNKVERLVLRRQEDIKDQSLECSIGNYFKCDNGVSPSF